MGESFQFARAFWNRSPDRLMACAALMSHGRWMHLRICRKRASSTSEFGFVPERNPIRRTFSVCCAPAASGTDLAVTSCDDDIDIETHKLGREGWEACWLVLSRSNFKREVLALDVTHVTHCSHEYIGLKGIGCQNADAVHLPRLLCLTRERRKSEAESENDRESDQPHEHLGGGWLAGV